MRVALLLGGVMLGAPLAVFSDVLTWAQVQAVGGLSVGTPVEKSGTWILPLHADVSGLYTISNSPTVMNSAIVCYRVRATIQGSTIFLAIETSLPRANARSLCPPAELGTNLHGVYSVVYEGPDHRLHALGTIRIGT